jgi:hypothetical protein
VDRAETQCKDIDWTGFSSGIFGPYLIALYKQRLTVTVFKIPICTAQ